MTDEDTETIGDSTEVDCPWCGLSNCLIDVATDGCLESGYESKCYHCSKEWEITAVDWEATVYVQRRTRKYPVLP